VCGKQVLVSFECFYAIRIVRVNRRMSEKGTVSSGWEDEKRRDDEQAASGNRKLFVGGLPEKETSESVRGQFEAYGEIKHIVHKGDYAFIVC
jgi:hypothetical protein